MKILSVLVVIEHFNDFLITIVGILKNKTYFYSGFWKKKIKLIL